MKNYIFSYICQYYSYTCNKRFLCESFKEVVMYLKKHTGALLFLVILLLLTNITSLYFIFLVRDEITEKRAQEAVLIENNRIIDEYAQNIKDLKNELEKYKKEYENLQKTNEDLKNLNNELEKRVNEMLPSYERWNLFESRYGTASRANYDRTSHLENTGAKKVMRVTAYTEYECDKSPDHPYFGITASGNRVSKWFTVAAGKELPFGTRIYIPYFKDMENNDIFVVEDRGGAIKENCLDIYTPDETFAKEFGCQWLDVYILE